MAFNRFLTLILSVIALAGLTVFVFAAIVPASAREGGSFGPIAVVVLMALALAVRWALRAPR